MSGNLVSIVNTLNCNPEDSGGRFPYVTRSNHAAGGNPMKNPNRKPRDMMFFFIVLSCVLFGCEQQLPSDTSSESDVTVSRDVPTTEGIIMIGGCLTGDDCDDGISCTEDRCIQGVCKNIPVDDACSDGDTQCVASTCEEFIGCVKHKLSSTPCDAGLCAQAGVCTVGQCIPVGQVKCDDGDDCTVNLCDPTVGCNYQIDVNQTCDDGNPFTGNDKCSMSGVCSGETKNKTCNVPSDCATDDLCVSYSCENNTCILPVFNDEKCDDNVACTVDTCSSSGGCNHTPNMGVCNANDMICDPTYGCVECVLDEQCNDSNSCTIDKCIGTTCKYYVSFDLDNDGKLDDDESTQKKSCDDENACYTQSFCNDGQCIFGVERVCNDGLTNTYDSCEPEFGCLYTPGVPEDGSNPNPNPSVLEKCNGIDDDGDGQTDEGASDCTQYYKDSDGDGYGAPGSFCLCKPQGDWKVKQDSDCNDANSSVHPNATEVCNGLNDDCDGQIDEGNVCGGGSGGNTESCNGVDDDGDGYTDEEGASGCVTYYYDSDNDGYGGVGTGKCYCNGKQPNSSWKLVDSDCNDSNSSVKPGQSEVCGNSIDDNCSGGVDENCNGSGGGNTAGTCQISTTNSNYYVYGTSSDCAGNWCPQDGTKSSINITNGGYLNAHCSTSGCGVEGSGYAVAWTVSASVSNVQVINVFNLTLQSNGNYENATCRCVKMIGTPNGVAANLRCEAK